MDMDSHLKELGIEPMDGGQFLASDDDELALLQKQLAARLPESYRRFLSKYGAAYFGPIVMLRSVNPLPRYLSASGDCLVDYFYGRNKSSRPHSKNIRTYSDRMPETLIPIGDDSGNQICLGVRGPEIGKVYYWDHHREWDAEKYLEYGLPLPSDLKFQNVHLIAESFEDFIQRLYVAPE